MKSLSFSLCGLCALCASPFAVFRFNAGRRGISCPKPSGKSCASPFSLGTGYFAAAAAFFVAATRSLLI